MAEDVLPAAPESERYPPYVGDDAALRRRWDFAAGVASKLSTPGSDLHWQLTRDMFNSGHPTD